jgi:hypothetical protein
MNILKNEHDGFRDESCVFETRFRDDKMYFVPISQSEPDRNSALTQNPGW